MDDLITVIRKIVEDELAPAKITNLFVEPDEDHDGDPILRIKIVFEVEEGHELDSRKVIGLARHLREPLENLGEARFPVFNFETTGEHAGAAA